MPMPKLNSFNSKSKEDKHHSGKLHRSAQGSFMHLLFLNGRRPAEVTNLEVEQWELAKRYFYLTQQQRLALGDSSMQSKEKYGLS